MQEKPRFSVVIATYNNGRYLHETLDSVLAQRYRDFEIVVIDDGSTDDTSEVIKPYLERVRYHRKDNGGAATAWNAGIRRARGDYISLLAGDDHWEPYTLERVAAAFDAHPDVGFVAVNARVMDSRGQLTGAVYGKKSAGRFYTTRSLLWGDPGGASWFTVKREVLDRVGLHDETLRSTEDNDLLLRISFATRMMNIEEPLMRYRVHGASLSRDQRLNAECWLVVLDKLEREHPEFVREHPWVFRRTRAKELMRLGRETMAHGEPGPETWRDSRRLLVRSIRTFPFFRRAYLYLLWSVIAPSTLRGWRRREESRRLARPR